jgi:cytochrome P450
MELFNPLSSDWLSCKFEMYKKMQVMDTAYYCEKYNGYVITRYDDVKYALKNHDIFSSGRGNLIQESPHRFNRTLGASDDPMHSILKNIVKEAYSKENIQRIVDCFVERSTELLAVNNSVFNLSSLVEEASAWVSTEILNLPHCKKEVHRLVLGILRYASQSVAHNVDQSYYNEFTKLIVSLLKNKVPSVGPGIYHEFITHSKDDTLISLFTGPTISGVGSLSGALGFLAVDLYREDLFETLNQDRSLIPGLINESLRYNSSSGRKVRTVTRDISMHNVSLKLGDKVILSLEAANRDPNMFADPDKFLPERENAGSLAFGYGMHACIASVISKKVLQVWVELLLGTLGKYKITPDPSGFVFQITSSGNQDSVTNLMVETI